MKRTKLILGLVGMVLLVMSLIPAASAATEGAMAQTTYHWATGASGLEPNPGPFYANITGGNFTTSFWTNASGSWVCYKTNITTNTKRVLTKVIWDDMTIFGGHNGSTTTYYWRICTKNNTVGGGLEWINNTYSFTVRELTMAEETTGIVIAFVGLIITVALIVFFMQGITKWMKF